jgi:uncharacterized membrane protein YhaH (DUF805 family)
MQPRRSLFSVAGRIPRGRYWLGVLLLFLWTGLVLVVALTVASGTLAAIVLGLGMPPAVFAGVSLAIRRLHDRDKSGWWVILYLFVPGVLDQWARQGDLGNGSFLLHGFSLLISTWWLVEFGFMRGTVGPNRFGPDPVDGPEAGLPAEPGLPADAAPDTWQPDNDRPDAAVPLTR